MRVDIVMQQMGESIAESTITRWIKKPGDRVEQDEPIFEISTDKVDAEIPSPVSGVLAEVKNQEGDTVEIFHGPLPVRRAQRALRPGHTPRAWRPSLTSPAAAPRAARLARP